MVLRGHFDGKKIVLDDPIPPGVSANVPVTVHFVEKNKRSVLDEIAELAVESDDLPTDFSEQHDHYVKGTPRK